MRDTPPPRHHNPPPWIADDPVKARKFWAAAAKEQADWDAAQARRNRGIRGLIRRTRARNTDKTADHTLQGFYFGPGGVPVRTIDHEPPDAEALYGPDPEPATEVSDDPYSRANLDDDLLAAFAADSMNRQRMYARYGPNVEAPDAVDERTIAEWHRRLQAMTPAERAAFLGTEPAAQPQNRDKPEVAGPAAEPAPRHQWSEPVYMRANSGVFADPAARELRDQIFYAYDLDATKDADAPSTLHNNPQLAAAEQRLARLNEQQDQLHQGYVDKLAATITDLARREGLPVTAEATTITGNDIPPHPGIAYTVTDYDTLDTANYMAMLLRSDATAEITAAETQNAEQPQAPNSEDLRPEPTHDGLHASHDLSKTLQGDDALEALRRIDAGENLDHVWESMADRVQPLTAAALETPDQPAPPEIPNRLQDRFTALMNAQRNGSIEEMRAIRNTLTGDDVEEITQTIITELTAREATAELTAAGGAPGNESEWEADAPATPGNSAVAEPGQKERDREQHLEPAIPDLPPTVTEPVAETETDRETTEPVPALSLDRDDDTETEKTPPPATPHDRFNQDTTVRIETEQDDQTTPSATEPDHNHAIEAPDEPSEAAVPDSAGITDTQGVSPSDLDDRTQSEDLASVLRRAHENTGRILAERQTPTTRPDAQPAPADRAMGGRELS